MLNSTPPRVHAWTAAAWLDFLDGLGDGVDADRPRSGRPIDPDGSSVSSLPCRSLCDRAARAARAGGLDGIGLRIADRVGMESLPPDVLASVARSETLHEGLRVFGEQLTRVVSNVQVYLEERPASVYACLRNRSEEDGQVELTWWTLGLLIQLVRLFLGREWQPSVMAVPSQGGGRGLAPVLLPRTRFVSEPERVWIAVPRSRLDARPKAPRGIPDDQDALPTGEFVGSLRGVVRSLIAEGTPNIKLAARRAGTSVRTLQRRLQASGRTFSQVVDETRYQLARDALLDSEAKIIDVAFDTGYDDPSHFSRAFRRLSGLSPSEYRLASGAPGPVGGSPLVEGGYA